MKNERNIDFRATTTSRHTQSVVEMHRHGRYPFFQRGLGGFSSTAQFMQADNFIQTPEDYIGYNRYAYCRYNPFKYTDPSGEMLINDFDDFASVMVLDSRYSPTISMNACEDVNAARDEALASFQSFMSWGFRRGIGRPGNSGSGKGKSKGEKSIGERFVSWFKGIFNSKPDKDTKTGNISKSKGEYKEGEYEKKYIQTATVPVEDVGANGSYTALVSIIIRESNSSHYADISAEGFTGASQMGFIDFGGSVTLMCGSNWLGYSKLERPTDSFLPISSVGVTTFLLPNYQAGMYFNIRIGYTFYNDQGSAVPIPSSMSRIFYIPHK